MAKIVNDRKRSLEEAVSYAIAHRIRIEILCLLNETVYSATELAELTHWPLTTIGHHIKKCSARALLRWRGSKRSATPISTSIGRLNSQS